MRAVVLVFSVALVGICSKQPTVHSSFVGVYSNNLAPIFAAGKTYVYKYEALLLGGLPEEALAKAGLKLSSKVHISAAEQNVYMLKLAEPELYEFSGVWPKDPLAPAAKLTSALAAQLKTPIKFEYTNGIVGKVLAPERISTPVLNIYRGILNILQLNIKKTQNVYELQETGTQGVCKTIYAITEDEKAEHILLTKTRDLNHCQEKIMKDMGLAYAEKCAKCQQDSKNLRGATAYSYTLKSAANSVQILEATVNELIQFSPFSEKNGAAQMETKQSLVFLETRVARIVPAEAEYHHRGSLKYEFSTELLQTPIHLMKINNAQAQIMETLNHLVRYNDKKVHEDAPLKFVELVQLLRVTSLEDIEMLWSHYKTKPTYRQWLLDAVPAIGTHVALRFIKDKVLADELTASEGAQAMIASTHMVTADAEAIKLVKALAIDSKILENPVLRKIVLLGYGTMIFKHCAEEDACPSNLIKPIQELLAEAVAEGETEAISLLLKVLGNAGHASSLKSITKVLPIHGTAARSLPTRVHIDAILALRNLAKREPKMTQELALLLYMDKSLPSELRMLACIVLFETRPPMGLVTTLANIAKTERNLQVAGFTYSHMKSLTRSTAVIHASVAAACNVAVKILSPRLERLSLRFSKAIYTDVYNSPLMLGAAASAFYINDAATILPKSIVTKISANLAGAEADVMELGVRTEGLQEALLKNRALTESADRITKMKRVIKALTEWRSLPNSKPLASVYFKFFGQEIAFANIDQAWFEQAVGLVAHPAVRAFGRDAVKAWLAGASFHFAKSVLAPEVRRIMPTAAGLPMELSLTTAAVAAAAVQVKATTWPALPENFNIAQLLKTDIQLETEIRPSVAVNTYAVMGVNTALLQAAVVSRAKLTSILPAKIVARLDISEGNFKIETLPVSVSEEIAAAHVETVAVARNVEDLAAARITPIVPAEALQSASRDYLTSRIDSRTSDSLPTSSEIISQDEAAAVKELKAAHFEKKYTVKAAAIGLKGCFKVATKNAAFIRNTALYKLAGGHSVALSLQAIEEEAIEKLELEIQLGPKAAEKLVKQIQLGEEETAEQKPILKKLRKLLVPGLRNSTLSSSSSSSSSSNSNSSSSSRNSNGNSSRSSRSSNSNSSRSSRSSRSSNSNSSRSSRSSNSNSSRSSRSSNSNSSRSSRSSNSNSSRSSSSSSSGRSSSRSSRSSNSNSSRSSSSSSSGRSRSQKLRSSRPVSRSFRSSRSSSASTFASLFSASSSSSQSSAESKQVHYYNRFQWNDKKQAAAASPSGSRYSASSFEAIYRQNKFLGDTAAPAFAVIFRAVRADRKLQGYQVAAYLDKPTARIQVILAALAADNNWRLCADGLVLSKHKVTAKVAWGAECKQYNTLITAETGLVGPNPAARVKVAWSSLPSALKHWAKRVSTYIPSILADVIQQKAKNSPKLFSFTAVATADRTLDLLCKTPRRSIYKLGWSLPIALPLDEVKRLNPSEDLANKVLQMLSKAGAAECSFDRHMLTTFNSRTFKNEMPQSCYQVLAKDCTDELKFMVLLKKDRAEQNHINVKIADIDIDLYPKNNEVILNVNGLEIPITRLPYQHPTAQVQISQKDEGISVHAPSHGLDEVYFNKNSLRVRVVDWMKGQTCGLCGKADGEVRQEYRMPNGRFTKNAVTYAHSWVLPAESCRDTSECRMKFESVPLEKQVNSHVQESRCFSAEPVLRCLPGCFPVKTATLTVGFRCQPNGSASNHADPSSVNDLREQTEAHLACSCTAQCA